MMTRDELKVMLDGGHVFMDTSGEYNMRQKDIAWSHKALLQVHHSAQSTSYDELPLLAVYELSLLGMVERIGKRWCKVSPFSGSLFRPLEWHLDK